jgi:all-trans-8'-apo-beta-carotenal 15,15'-oxygenase
VGHRFPAALRCYRVDPSGRLDRVGSVPLRSVIVQHDFAITARYLVFAIAPITVDPVSAALSMLGRGVTGDAADYRPGKGMRVVLVPRAGGPNRIIECDPFVYVHVDNAYDDGEDMVLDVVRHESFDFLTNAAKHFRTGLPGVGHTTRLRVTKSGRVEREDMPELDSIEFPMHDERRTGRAHRYSYFVAYHPDRDAAIVKLDRQTSSTRRHVFTAGEVVGEPVFVPRSATAAEDDGWILTVTYLPAEHRTALFILDANDIERGPLAVARLDHHYFPGFHGSFTEQV